jgi:hypothetical protein
LEIIRVYFWDRTVFERKNMICGFRVLKIIYSYYKWLILRVIDRFIGNLIDKRRSKMMNSFSQGPSERRIHIGCYEERKRDVF